MIDPQDRSTANTSLDCDQTDEHQFMDVDSDPNSSFYRTQHELNSEWPLAVSNPRCSNIFPQQLRVEDIFPRSRKEEYEFDFQFDDLKQNTIVHSLSKGRRATQLNDTDLISIQSTSNQLAKRRQSAEDSETSIIEKVQSLSGNFLVANFFKKMSLPLDKHWLVKMPCEMCNTLVDIRLFPYHLLKHIQRDTDLKAYFDLNQRCNCCHENYSNIKDLPHVDQSKAFEANTFFCKQCAFQHICSIDKNIQKNALDKSINGYRCTIANCNEKAESFYKFILHFYLCHEDSYCPYCFVPFNLLGLSVFHSDTTASKQLQHIKTISDRILHHIQLHFAVSRVFSCHICLFSFVDKMSWQNHLQLYHQPGSQNHRRRRAEPNFSLRDNSTLPRDIADRSVSSVTFAIEDVAPPQPPPIMENSSCEEIESNQMLVVAKKFRNMTEDYLSLTRITFSKNFVKHYFENQHSEDKIAESAKNLHRMSDARKILLLNSFERLQMRCGECREKIGKFHYLKSAVDCQTDYPCRTRCLKAAYYQASSFRDKQLTSRANSKRHQASPLLINKKFFLKSLPTPSAELIVQSKDEDNEYDYMEEVRQVTARYDTEDDKFFLKICETCGKYLPEIKSIFYHLLANPTHQVIRRNLIYLYRLMEMEESEREEKLPRTQPSNVSFSNHDKNFIFDDISIDQVFANDDCDT